MEPKQWRKDVRLENSKHALLLVQVLYGVYYLDQKYIFSRIFRTIWLQKMYANNLPVNERIYGGMHCGQMFSDNTESEIILSIIFLPTELAKPQPVKSLSEGEASISSPPLRK